MQKNLILPAIAAFATLAAAQDAASQRQQPPQHGKVGAKLADFEFRGC